MQADAPQPCNSLKFRAFFADVFPVSDASRPNFDYSIDISSRLVTCRVDGQLSFGRIANYAASLRADPRFNPSFSEVVDLCEATSVSLSPAEVMILADQVDPFAHDSLRAFVVKNQAQVNAAQFHRILRTESKNIRIFFSMDEARAWIQEGSDRSAVAGA